MSHSTSKKYMEELKRDVLHVTEDYPKEERKFALDFLRKHLYHEELLNEAIEFFEKPIVFGQGSMNPDVAILTESVISTEAKEKLLTAFNKMGLSECEVYFATANFVATKKHAAQRRSFHERALEILNPQFLLIFDDLDADYDLQGDIIELCIPVESVLDKENESARRLINRILKNIHTFYK